MRQHRRDEAGHVRRERRGARRRGRAACPAPTNHETSAMCTHARIPFGLAPERERVVEVLRRVGVDRVRRQVAQVDAARSGSRSGGSCGSNGCRAPCSTSSASRTFSIRVGRPERSLDVRAAAPGRTTARSPGLEVAEPLRLEHDRHARREVRLADDELPAPADLDDDALIGQTRRKRRIVRPEPTAPRPGPRRAG